MIPPDSSSVPALKAQKETTAEGLARRWYRRDHFCTQVDAERAYFRALVDSLERGRVIAALSRKLGRARDRANALNAINRDLRAQLAALKGNSHD